MGWLHSHGITSNLDDYLALPLPVLLLCRELMEAELRREELLGRRREVEARYRNSR